MRGPYDIKEVLHKYKGRYFVLSRKIITDHYVSSFVTKIKLTSELFGVMFIVLEILSILKNRAKGNYGIYCNLILLKLDLIQFFFHEFQKLIKQRDCTANNAGISLK